jgi:hypothetical protein
LSSLDFNLISFFFFGFSASLLLSWPETGMSQEV